MLSKLLYTYQFYKFFSQLRFSLLPYSPFSNLLKWQQRTHLYQIQSIQVGIQQLLRQARRSILHTKYL